jgi:hypothetical protein
MARKFYTPIDLTGLELQNAKIQNLASDPTGYGAGGIYYNTAHNEIRVYNGTTWVPVGGAIEYGNTAGRPSAGNAGRVYADTQAGTLFLDNGSTWVQIGMSASATTDNVTEGSTNLYFTDTRARGAVSASGGISYDSSTGAFSIDYSNLETQLQSDGYITGTEQYIQSTDSNFSVSGTELTLNTSNAATTLTTGATYTTATGGVIDLNLSALETQLQNDGYITGSEQYIQSVSSDFTISGTELTINTSTLASDLNSDIATNLANGSTYISDTSGILDLNISALETQLQTDGYITGSEQYIQSTDSNFIVSGTELTLNSEIQVQKTSYWRSGTQQGVIAAQSDSSLRLTAITGALELESNDGDVSLNPSTGNIQANNAQIKNLTDPTDAQDAATKHYVDGVAQGLRIKDSLDAIAIVPVTGTYTDGTADASGGLGVGATFTTTVSALDTATGDTDEVNDRVGLFAQATATQNGIYTVTANDGTNVTLTRSVYEDNSSLDELHYGNFYFVSAGTSAGTGWVLTNEGTGTDEDIKIGTDPVEFTQFSGSGAYIGGDGISISGNTISAVVQGTKGLQLTSSGIGVNAGTGLEFNGSTGALQVTDYTYLTKKMAQTIGNTSDTSFDIYHNFGTLDVSVTIYDTSTKEEVFADVTHSSTSKVNVNFAVAPGTDAFRVVVVG